MEKFYVVTDESSLKKDYLDYKKNDEMVREHIKNFMIDNGILTKEYAPTDESLYIIPTKEDINTFDTVLCKADKNGLRQFKKGSKIGKAWIKSLKEKDLTILHKPFVAFYFDNCYGKHRTRLFDINGVVYTSMNLTEYDEYDFGTPQGMKEIKASEFYKIIENNK